MLDKIIQKFFWRNIEQDKPRIFYFEKKFWWKEHARVGVETYYKTTVNKVVVL